MNLDNKKIAIIGLGSLADISKAQRLLGYAPTQRIGEGLVLGMPWYVLQEKKR